MNNKKTKNSGLFSKQYKILKKVNLTIKNKKCI